MGLVSKPLERELHGCSGAASRLLRLLGLFVGQYVKFSGRSHKAQPSVQVEHI